MARTLEQTAQHDQWLLRPIEVEDPKPDLRFDHDLAPSNGIMTHDFYPEISWGGIAELGDDPRRPPTRATVDERREAMAQTLEQTAQHDQWLLRPIEIDDPKPDLRIDPNLAPSNGIMTHNFYAEITWGGIAELGDDPRRPSTDLTDGVVTP